MWPDQKIVTVPTFPGVVAGLYFLAPFSKIGPNAKNG
jgi:hypothetical protein